MAADKDKKELFQKYNTPAVTMGYTIMAAICFFSFVGYQLDQKLKTQYWTLVGVFAGFLYSGYEVWKLIQREKEQDLEEKKNLERKGL